MARPADPEPRGSGLLAFLRDAHGPLTLNDLRAAGFTRPAASIYQLQLDGHRITRGTAGLELFEGERRAPQPLEPPPRVRIRPREPS